jgi:hypothetical protein
MQLELMSFLSWLVTSVGAGSVASWILERIPKFQALEAGAKKMWVFGTSSVLAIAAFLVIQFVPAGTLEMIAPYFAIVAAMFASAFSGEMFHRFLDR